MSSTRDPTAKCVVVLLRIGLSWQLLARTSVAMEDRTWTEGAVGTAFDPLTDMV